MQYQITTPETISLKKRKWLLTSAIIALLVLLISSSVVYAITTNSSKASSSSVNKGIDINLNHSTQTQNSGNQHPNTGTSKVGNPNQPTATASQNTNNNQPVNTGALIVITPAHKDIKNNYTITAVPGTPNTAQHQIAAHLLTSTQSQSQTVNATGQGTTQATAAQGSITVLNSSASPFTFAAGTQIQTTNYSAGTITVTLDQGGTVPAADATTTPATPGQLTVPAHTLATGSIANIPALAINTSPGPNGDSYVNNAAFTGGQDVQTYTVLLQSDIDNGASTLSNSLTPAAQNGVQAQIHTNQQPIQQIQCTSSVASHDPAGSAVVSTTITVAVTCTGEVYAPQDAQNMALGWLQHDASVAAYPLAAQPAATITQTQLSNPQQGIITITVQAEGTGIFQFSNAQKQQLAQSIAGQSTQNAQATLAKQIGVAKATITISNGGSILPQNPQQIFITISS